MKNNNDKIILDLKKQIEKKKKEIKSSERFSPKTNCNLVLGSERFNIHVLDIPDILTIIAKLQSMKDGLFSVLPEEKLEIGGFLVDDWIGDLKSKYLNLNRKKEEERLKSLEQKLNNLLSNDTKVELELEELKKQI